GPGSIRLLRRVPVRDSGEAAQQQCGGGPRHGGERVVAYGGADAAGHQVEAGRPHRPAGDRGGAGQPGGGVGGQVVGVVGESDGVLDGLVAALAEGGRHGVGGVADQGGASEVEGGQRFGDVVDVVPEHVLGAGRGQDLGDRGVP